MLQVIQYSENSISKILKIAFGKEKFEDALELALKQEDIENNVRIDCSRPACKLELNIP